MRNLRFPPQLKIIPSTTKHTFLIPHRRLDSLNFGNHNKDDVPI
uniref:Uncharacterized protein n=1 Tax=Cryptococcus bacillisporus CA1280 TaxID=1296109 RepID=A0A0D0VL73_CRYGA|nr:hypothetical protein I312_05097 [Cryptococcus bacillisporus CA1280]